jgi:hypothetical protein
MQKYYSKSKLLLLIISLFVATGFFSCEKDIESLRGTSWESDSIEGKLDPNFTFEGNNGLIIRDGKISIFFDRRNKYHNAYIDFHYLELYDSISGNAYDIPCVPAITRYTYKRKNLTLKFKDNLLLESHWTGKIEGDIMTLENVFGATVKFRKL